MIDKKTLLTTANLVSLTGFFLVLAGCVLMYMAADRSETAAGLAFIVAGRLADLLDGTLARHSGQTSTFGALLDAALDKLAGLAIVIVLLLLDMAPLWAIVLIFLQNLSNIIATYMAKRRGQTKGLKPSMAGKYAMAVQNLALGLYVVSYLVAGGSPAAGEAVQYLANAAIIIGTIVLGGLASWGYFKRV